MRRFAVKNLLLQLFLGILIKMTGLNESHDNVLAIIIMQNSSKVIILSSIIEIETIFFSSYDIFLQ